EESGCAVCGRLIQRRYLSPRNNISGLMHLLCADGNTRCERKSDTDPIQERSGPVIEESCTKVCNECREFLRRDKVPRNALANGLWLGSVPEELAILRYAERLLVSRVRLNNCIFRISSGFYKMRGHVIAFESPIPKIYNKLPPPVEDLDEVLAILFTGPELPTTADFQRTPLLIRRKVVKKALEWLKLNHKDYHDLTIDYKILQDYPENMPPVSVQYKKMNSNTSTESMSVFEQESEEGVEDGPCPFAVHGLTSA
ncbi:hypothetical protein BDN72DRAFT_725713, partial [Pluteus cervinus]